MLKSVHQQEIRFGDIDVMGHVNNAVYLSYFEQARMSWFKQLIDGVWDWEKDGIVLARNEVDYLMPVLLSDALEIHTSCESIGNSSLTLVYEVFRKAQGQDKWLCCSRGKSVLVCFDYHKREKRGVPESWREKLMAS